jgi:Fe-S cluster assembly protein SufD
MSFASYDLGGRLVRNDVEINMAEPGAEVDIVGLYVAGEGQHIDNHIRVDHRVGPTTSSQEYRGILNGNCRCVWNGKAIVHEGADGTDASQANHNLLLSDKAEIDTKPELEIYADDVKCCHGTTVGQLDEAALFYLRTRGLNKRRATEILTHAFAVDIVGRAPVSAARDAIASMVESRLEELVQDVAL